MAQEFFVPDLHMTAHFYRTVVHNNHDALRALLKTVEERGGFIGHADRDKIQQVVLNVAGIAKWPKDAVFDNTELWASFVKDKKHLYDLNENAWPWNAVWLPAR